MWFTYVHGPCDNVCIAAEYVDFVAAEQSWNMRVGGPCPYCGYPVLRPRVVLDREQFDRLRTRQGRRRGVGAAEYRLAGMAFTLELWNEVWHRVQGKPVGPDGPSSDGVPAIAHRTDAASLAAVFERAEILRDYGSFRHARRHHAFVLQTRRSLLGDEHPDVLDSRFALAQVDYNAGRASDARRAHEQVLAARRATLGDRHAATLTSRHALAEVARDLRRLADARRMHEHTLADRRALLGPEHPDTLMSMFALAETALAEGRHEPGVRGLDTVLELRRRILGPDHPDTLLAASNRAVALEHDGDLASVKALQEHVLEGAMRRLGVEHSTTLIAAFNLSRTVIRCGGDVDAVAPIMRHIVWLIDEDPAELQPALQHIRRELASVPDAAASSPLRQAWGRFRRLR